MVKRKLSTLLYIQINDIIQSIFNIVTVYKHALLSTSNKFFHSIIEICCCFSFNTRLHCFLFFFIRREVPLRFLLKSGKKWKSQGDKSGKYGGCRTTSNFNCFRMAQLFFMCEIRLYRVATKQSMFIRIRDITFSLSFSV